MPGVGCSGTVMLQVRVPRFSLLVSTHSSASGNILYCKCCLKMFFSHSFSEPNIAIKRTIINYYKMVSLRKSEVIHFLDNRSSNNLLLLVQPVCETCRDCSIEGSSRNYTSSTVI